MPRIGMNPERGQKSNYQPQRVTLAMLTYLPNQAGYFEHRFEVSRLAVESLIAHTPEPFDLLVFDNASCPPMVDYLRSLYDQGKIRFLVLSSENIGKLAALKLIFEMAPGEIVAYSDDDIFFLPGWLDAHLKILDTFPKVGLVTGFYIRSHVGYAAQTIEAFAGRPDVAAKRGFLIPREVEQHYIDNMGRTWDSYQQEVQGLEDLSLTYQGVEALASAGHHQFVAPRQLMQAVLPKQWEGQLMGKMKDLEAGVDQSGYLRLSTYQPTTRLLGNIVSPEMAAEAQGYGLNAQGVALRKLPALSKPTNRFYSFPPVRRLAQAVYNRLHVIINS